MVTEHKKRYMLSYNQRASVKAKKAEYMRKVRAERDKIAGPNLVRLLLSAGYDALAFEYAQERAPEMLATVSAVKPKQKS